MTAPQNAAPTKQARTSGQRAGGARANDSGQLSPSSIAQSKPTAQTENGRGRELARVAIRDLLAGQDPDGADVAAMGAYGEAYAALTDAHKQAGTAGARAAFETLARANPALGWLVGADPEPPKVEWTTRELLTTQFPDPKWAVPGLVPVGLSFLAGRPKLGKSWLGMQIAVAVGTGGRVFDEAIEPGRVLFLALEDSPRRLKERLAQQGAPESADVTWRTEWPDLTGDGIDELASAVQSDNYGLVVIDTLSRAVGQADQQDLAQMTVLLGRLQRLAHLLDMAVLVIDHHRKSSALGPNPIDDIMGSTGKAAVADALLGLYKEQGKRGAVLAVTGRDIDERSLALEWDAVTRCWQCLGAAGDVQEGTRKADITQAIPALARMGQLPTIANVAEFCDMRRPHVSRAINDLVTAGKVIRGPKEGREQPYYLPDQVQPLEIDR